MLKFLIKMQKNKYIFHLKAAGLIVCFVLFGTLIAGASGITNQLSKLFYYPPESLVAGEYTVRIAQVATSPYEEFMKANGGGVTTFEQRKQEYLNDNGVYFVDVEADHEYQALWAWLENNDPQISQGVDWLLNQWADYSCTETCEIKADAYRAMVHSNISSADRDRIHQKYEQEVDRLRNDPTNSAFYGVRNFNQVLQYVAGLYLFLQDNPDLNGGFTYDYYNYPYTPWGWKDFTYQGRTYTRGGSYTDLFQFLQDYLEYHADWYVRNDFSSYEGDSRSYGWTHMNAYIQIYDFTNNAELKNKAKMLLDFMMLDQGMEFSADQIGGKSGGKDNDGGAVAYYTRKRDNVNYECILMGLGCSYPAAYKPDYNVYLTTYRVADPILDAVDIRDEADDYWQEVREYNENVHDANKGKLTYVTKFYNLGGGDNYGGSDYGWLLNILSNDTDANGDPIGIPFRLWTNTNPIYDNVRDYPGNEVPGGEFYHYRNALWSPTAGQNLHFFTWEDQTNYTDRLSHWDYDDVDPVEDRRYFQEGRTMVVVENDGNHVFIETAIQGVDYADMDAFRTAFETNHTTSQTTSRGDVIGRSAATGDTTINGNEAYNYPFGRIETVDNNGHQIVNWDRPSQVMTLDKHGAVCTYDFQNWTESGDCAIAGPPPGCTCDLWQDQNCGEGSCPSEQRRQTRSCDPAGCDTESHCVTDPSCEPPPPPPCPYNQCASGDSCDNWYGDATNLCCVDACNGGAMGTNWNPPYPRVSFQYPAAESHYTGCQELYSKFDLAAINFDNPDSCAPDIKQRNPQIILLATLTDMMHDGTHFEYNAYRYFDPQTAVSIGTTDTEMRLTNTEGEGFPRWEVPEGSGNLPYGRWGAAGFIVGPDRTVGRPTYTPDRFTYGLENHDWNTHVEESTKTLLGLGDVDTTHSANSYIRLPIKTAGWLYNITAANPYSGEETARYFIDNERLSSVNYDNFHYYDGGHYATYRLDWLLNGFDGDGSANHVGSTVDFDMNWNQDSDEHGLDWINNEWHGDDGNGNPTSAGLNYMWNYEKQRMNEIRGGGSSIVVPNSGFCAFPENDNVISWLDGFQLEAGVSSCYSWNIAFNKLRHWDEPNKYIIAVDGALSWDDDKYANYKNRFSDMRFGLATTLMGNAFYGRNVGPYFYFGLWYDEYETNLGYPKSGTEGEPHKISAYCINRNGSDYCPYVRFFTEGAVIVNPTFQPVTISEDDISGLAGYDGPYYRFIGGQDAAFNNGAPLSDGIELSGSLGEQADRDNDDHGDGVLLFTNDDYRVVSDIVVGNYNNNDTSPGSEPVAADMSDWLEEEVNSNNPYYSQWDMRDASEGYGQFYTSNSNATARFTPTIGVSGDYEVYEWHGWHGGSGGDDEASNVSATINYAGGTDSATIDQTTNYGQWNLLGTYNFNAGTSGYVEITSNGANGVVIADAVKFRYTNNAGGPPPATCDCTAWEDQGCGEGSCASDRRLQTRSCVDPASCSESQCISDPSCEIVEDYKSDANIDNIVDIYDFGILMSCWGTAYIPSDPAACAANANPPVCRDPDTTGDDITDVDDLGVMLSCWGTNDEPNCLATEPPLPGCGETATCTPDGCNAVCPAGCDSLSSDPDCNGTACCGNTICETAAGEDNASCPGDCPLDGGGSVCGNGIQESGESCDGSDLAGQTCQTQGYDGGTLACTASCTFDTSECTSSPPPAATDLCDVATANDWQASRTYTFRITWGGGQKNYYLDENNGAGEQLIGTFDYSGSGDEYTLVDPVIHLGYVYYPSPVGITFSNFKLNTASWNIDDSLDSPANTSGQVNGGQFVAGGWQTTATGDNIAYISPLPLDASGEISFEVTGIEIINSVLTSDDNHFFGMWDGAEEENPDFGIINNPYKSFLRLFGPAAGSTYEGKLKGRLKVNNREIGVDGDPDGGPGFDNFESCFDL